MKHIHTHTHFLCHGMTPDTHLNAPHHLRSIIITKWPHLSWLSQWPQRFHAASCAIGAQKLALAHTEGCWWPVWHITKEQLSNTVHYFIYHQLFSRFHRIIWASPNGNLLSTQFPARKIFNMPQLKMYLRSMIGCFLGCFFFTLAAATDCEQSILVK